MCVCVCVRACVHACVCHQIVSLYSQVVDDHIEDLAEVSQCPCCEAVVPVVLRAKDLDELAEEARLRYIKAQKTSYWKQFEQGMLGRDAVRTLQGAADSAMDEANK